jgi:hypothetical protein
VEDGKTPNNVESETTAKRVDAEDSISRLSPKRALRVGEAKPQGYPVGEQETEQNT